jgi:hypothetical protein
VHFKSVLLGTGPAPRRLADAHRSGKGHRAQAGAGATPSSLLARRDAVRAGAGAACCQSFSLLTPSRRAGLRSGEPMPIAGGNLGAPKLAPPLQLQRPRVPGPCRAFSGEELRITDRIRRLPTARTSLHQLHCLKTHKLRLSVFALFCLRHYSEPIGTALGCARAVSCYGSFGHGSKGGSTFAVGRKSMCQPWKVSA